MSDRRILHLEVLETRATPALATLADVPVLAEVPPIESVVTRVLEPVARPVVVVTEALSPLLDRLSSVLSVTPPSGEGLGVSVLSGLVDVVVPPAVGQPDSPLPPVLPPVVPPGVVPVELPAGVTMPRAADIEGDLAVSFAAGPRVVALRLPPLPVEFVAPTPPAAPSVPRVDFVTFTGSSGVAQLPVVATIPVADEVVATLALPKDEKPANGAAPDGADTTEPAADAEPPAELLPPPREDTEAEETLGALPSAGLLEPSPFGVGAVEAALADLARQAGLAAVLPGGGSSSLTATALLAGLAAGTLGVAWRRLRPEQRRELARLLALHPRTVGLIGD